MSLEFFCVFLAFLLFLVVIALFWHVGQRDAEEKWHAKQALRASVEHGTWPPPPILRLKEVYLPCICCGFLVFEGMAYSFAPCPVCNWLDADCELRLATDTEYRDSLCAAQKVLLEQMPLIITTHGLYHRDPDWKPLGPAK